MVFLTHSLEWLGECCRRVGGVMLILLLIPVYLSAETEIPVLTTDTELATAGYYQLSWQPGMAGASNKNLHFELQKSNHQSFQTARTIYRGPDQASVISGQPNGNYYYRVRAIYSNDYVSDWSEAVLVKVKHHSLQRAWVFFITGAFVFLITLIFIIASASNKNRG